MAVGLALVAGTAACSSKDEPPARTGAPVASSETPERGPSTTRAAAGAASGPATTGRSTAAGPPRTSAPLQPGDVAIVDYAFVPQEITIAVGGTVVWMNEESDPPSDHWVKTSPGSAGTIDSARLRPGASYTKPFDAPGTYAYYCDIHNFMKGTVIVR